MKFKIKKWLILFTLIAIVLLIFSQRDTITTIRYYFANSGTNYQIDYVEVPFKLETQLLIPFRVNGGPFLDFALDTGSPTIAIIGNNKTEQLELHLGNEINVGGTGSSQTSTGRITNDLSLSIGNITLKNQTAIWIPWNQITFFESEQEVFIDGIIGYDLFKRFVVELDLDQGMMFLFPSENYQYDGAGESFELNISSRKPYVNSDVTTLDGRTASVKLHVDLGSSSSLTLIPNSVPGIEIPQETIPIPSWGVSGESTSALGRVKQLKIGSFVLDSVLTRFTSEGHSTANNRNGVLGLDVLSRFNVIFDYERNRMILEPRLTTFDPFTPNKTGIGFARYSDTYIVKYLISQSNGFKAGFTKGDILESINGYAASEMTWKELNDYLRNDSGTILEICVLRDGDRVCREVVLENPKV